MSIMLLAWALPDVLAVFVLLLATSERFFFKPRTYAEVAAGLLIAATPFVLTTPFLLPAKILLCAAQLCLLLLPARLLFGRLDKQFVFSSTRFNAVILAAALCMMTALWWLGNQYGVLGGYEWRAVGILLGVFALQLVFLAHNLWTWRHYRLAIAQTKTNLKDLPTVSVCIPARNETHVLEDCLVSVLASSYPKLEVLVMDDCSQDKTSQIIRSFAHDGVRFIQGETPADGWLGKNQAMQTLAEQATGDYFVFMDVDTRLGTASIAQLVDYAQTHNAKMVAVLPQNRLGVQAGALFGTLRYFWQMVRPVTRRHVPVAGQCWLAEAEALKKLGGFKSVAHAIAPEDSFAQRFNMTDNYRFIVGDQQLGITTAKRWPSQLESAVRVLYPMFKRQPIYALAGAAATAGIFLGPLALTIGPVINGTHSGLLAISTTTAALTFCNYGLVMRRIHPRVWALQMVLFPVVVLQEVVLILVSAMQYEFGEVSWKGRNVCYPIILSGQNQLAAEHGQQPAHPLTGL